MKPHIDISELVQRILSDLQRPEIEKTCASVVKEETKIDSSELHLESKVVTLTEIEGRLESVRKLLVPNRAVVTPAVKDELRKRGITLHFHAKHETPTETKTAIEKRDTRIWVALHAISNEPKAVLEMLRKNHAVAPQTFDCIVHTVEAAVTEIVSPCVSGVIMTGAPAVGLCLANRHETLRAVFAWDVQRLKIDLKQLGPNLLILDPETSGVYKTQEFLKTFLANDSRNAPKFLQPPASSLQAVLS